MAPLATVRARRVALACRPEDVQLVASASGVEAALKAVVQDAAYLGDHLEYTVKVGDRRLVVTGSRRAGHSVGETAFLALDPERITVWEL